MYIGGNDTLPPPLSRDEESRVIALLDAGDQIARQTLIERNLRLVVYIARRFENTGINIEDLISIGTIGLIKGISSFNAEKGSKLTTYVSRCIENEILMYFRVLKKQANEVSLSEPIDGEDEGGALSIMDTISVPDTMAEDFDFAESQRRLYEYIARNLDERERDIIIMRYGLFGTREYTQKEIAEIKGISRSYVSRIETKALKKLRSEFEK